MPTYIYIYMNSLEKRKRGRIGFVHSWHNSTDTSSTQR